MQWRKLIFLHLILILTIMELGHLVQAKKHGICSIEIHGYSMDKLERTFGREISSSMESLFETRFEEGSKVEEEKLLSSLLKTIKQSGKIDYEILSHLKRIYLNKKNLKSFNVFYIETRRKLNTVRDENEKKNLVLKFENKRKLLMYNLLVYASQCIKKGDSKDAETALYKAIHLGLENQFLDQNDVKYPDGIREWYFHESAVDDKTLISSKDFIVKALRLYDQLQPSDPNSIASKYSLDIALLKDTENSKMVKKGIDSKIKRLMDEMKLCSWSVESAVVAEFLEADSYFLPYSNRDFYTDTKFRVIERLSAPEQDKIIRFKYIVDGNSVKSLNGRSKSTLLPAKGSKWILLQKKYRNSFQPIGYHNGRLPYTKQNLVFIKKTATARQKFFKLERDGSCFVLRTGWKTPFSLAAILNKD